MRVCLICNQIAAWGKIGGFGTATRALGRGLVDRGIEVSAVVPRRSQHGQSAIEKLDGMTVYGIDPGATLTSGRIFPIVDAEIYHSQEPTIASWWAQRAMPDRMHVVTCRDPRGLRDHLIEFWYANLGRKLLAPVSAFYEASPWVKAAVRRADAVLTPAPSALDPDIRRLYGAGIAPRFLPYPVEIPTRPPAKSERPNVLFVGRFDRRKRVEIFFELATKFPEVQFTAVGESHDRRYDRRLRDGSRHLSNLELTGFVPRFGTPNVTEYYARAWILVNTSAREGLPYTFIEAAAQANAILSGVDPERFASRFGQHVADNDYAGGLNRLLKQNAWRQKGQAAAEYVAGIWNEAACVDRHLELYEQLLRNASGSGSKDRAAAKRRRQT